MHPDCQEELLQRACICVLAAWADVRGEGAIDGLCEITLEQEHRGVEVSYKRCISELLGIKHNDLKVKALERLAMELQDAEHITAIKKTLKKFQ